MNNTEYIKMFFKYNFSDEPKVILYEVDLANGRYLLRMINIFEDRTCKNDDDPYDAVLEVLPLETVEEINNGVWVTKQLS